MIHLGCYCTETVIIVIYVFNLQKQLSAKTGNHERHIRGWGGGDKKRLPRLHVFSCIIGGCDLCEVNRTNMSLV